MDIRRELGITPDNEYIESKRKIEAYIAYQDEYRREYGVFPELDKKNKPVTALLEEVYQAYDELKNRPITGMLFYHNIYCQINRKLGEIYHKYKREWSFMHSISFEYRNTFEDIKKIPECRHIENDLGYMVDSAGNYYEGTWQNGRLTYGLIYFANFDMYFIGEIIYADTVHYNGLTFDYSEDKYTNLRMGKFFVKNNALIPYNGEILDIHTDIKKNGQIDVELCIGTAIDGYEDGKFLYKYFNSGEVSIDFKTFREGAVKRDPGIGHYAFHLILGLYMLMWLMIKYTYGIPVCLILKNRRRKKHL